MAIAAARPRRPPDAPAAAAACARGSLFFVYDVEDVLVAAPAPSTGSLAALDEHVRELRTEVGDLRAQLETFRRQFE